MKTRIEASILILGAICFLVSCASLPRATEEDKNKTFTDVTYDKLFEAVKDTYLELDLAITAENQLSGFLNGQTRSSVGWSPAGYGVPARLFYGYYKARFYHSGADTKIQINISMATLDGFSKSEMNKRWYEEFWEVVQKNLY
jgi:hypothetical protein